MSRLRTASVALLLLAAACGGHDSAPSPDASLDSGSTPCTRPGCADPCDPDPCMEAHAVCVADGESARCDCEPGYHAVGATCEADDRCTDTTCSGHGTCEEGAAGVSCTCDAGYAGDFCDGCADGYLPDGSGGCSETPCDPNPCSEPGRELCEATAAGPVCHCSAGTHEEAGVCAPDLTCMPTTCSGHGTCTDTGSGLACDCDAGYAGMACDSCDEAGGYHADGEGGCTTDPCLPSPCTEPSRTVCVAEGVEARCDCDPGTHDDAGSCVPDETCEAGSCSGHGTCAVVGGVRECDCEVGFAGDVCDGCDAAAGYHVDGAGGCTTDPCTPNPCTAPDRTVCVDAGGTASCECDPGFHEDGVGGCTTDPCTPDPCAASGMACRVDGSGAAECYTPVCDDGNPCTDDAFTGGSCTYTPLADGTSCSTTICTTGQTCTGGTCGGGTVVTCDDGNPCTTDTCVDPTGCESAADDSLVPDDGIGCTVDSCTSGVASHTPSDGLCDDSLWCTGVEVCDPADPSADTAGCVQGPAPAPPGPSSPCRSYGACDEATDSFPLTILPAGASCDDGLACTSGDACVTEGGACAGSPVAGCPAPACTTTMDFPSAIDLPTAAVTGDITLDGGPVPASVPSTYAYDVQLYAVAQDTDELHLIGVVRYDYDSSGSYPLEAGSDRIDTRLVPGIYDILYRRGLSSSSSPRYVYETRPADPFAHGYRVLRKDVVIGPGANTLDVDMPTASVTGAITLDGAPVPSSVPSTYAYDVQLYAVARDTGESHLIGVVRYDYDSSGTYPLEVGSDAIDTRLVPGTYDILYRRGLSSSSSPRYVYETRPADPYAHGYRILQAGVVISAGANTLDVDIATASVSGAITLDGAPVPSSVPSTYAYDVQLYAVAHDTGESHLIGVLRYDYDSSGTYPLEAGSDAIDTRLVPGTYDILYRRGLSSSSSPRYVYESRPGDPFAHGYRILQTDVTIGPGATTLDVDIPTAAVTGSITLDGSPVPSSVPSTYAYDVQLYAVAHDTGESHLIGVVRYDYDSSGTYPLEAGSDAIDTRLVPGTYDILYRRGLSSSSSPRYVYESRPGDPFAHGYRILQSDVTIGPGATTLDVDIPTTAVTGDITLDGSPVPSSVPSTYAYDVQLYAVARDTGESHLIGVLRYDYDSSGTYPLEAGSDAIATRLLPGTYDILYRRGLSSSSSPRYVYETRPADPFAHGYRILQSGVVVGGSSTTVDVDIPTGALTAPITLDGSAVPSSVPSTYAYDVQLYAVARDTGESHLIGVVRYDYDSSGTYPLEVGSDAVDTRLLPGTYDLLYRRGLSSSSSPRYVYETRPADPFAHGYRYLGTCFSLP